MHSRAARYPERRKRSSAALAPRCSVGDCERRPLAITHLHDEHFSVAVQTSRPLQWQRLDETSAGDGLEEAAQALEPRGDELAVTVPPSV